jgi:sugar/nucleoside kinase (ribokinase family)
MSTTDARWDVMAIGAVAVDDLVYVERYPAPDTKSPILDELREGGGLAGTALVTVARLGGTAAYVGVLGNDDLSSFTITELEREGVDCSHVDRRADTRPIHSVIVVDRSNGQRTLLYSLAGVTEPDPARITAGLVRQARVLLVDSTVTWTGRHAAALARDAGVPIVADLEDPDAPGVVQLARVVDHLIVGTAFAQRLTGAGHPAEMVRALWRPDASACVVTAGDAGCWYAAGETGGEVIHHPARRVQALDTNGCGDVFHGAYAAGIARGDSVARSVAVATVAAAQKATQHGGRRGIPDRAAIERLLATDGEVLSMDHPTP